LKILLFIALAALAFIGINRLTRRNAPNPHASAGSAPGMDFKQARAVLGLEERELDKQIVVATHRKLMQHVHPDKGGSVLLAQQLNEAKRVLLSHL